MIDIVGKKIWYFLFSGLMIIPGLVALGIWGLNLGIDFTGGTLLEYQFQKNINKNEIESVIREKKIEVSSVATTSENTYLIRTKPLDDAKAKEADADLDTK